MLPSQTAQQTPEPQQSAGIIGNAEGTAPIVLVCEHASNHIPAYLNNLGVSDQVIKSHVAWDPGTRGVTEKLAQILDAPFVLQTVSRLVYDCNRPFDAPSAMPVKSEIFDIPGNVNLAPSERHNRLKNVYEPFRDKVQKTVQAAVKQHKTPLFVTIHSFTPVFFGEPRAVEIGVLHDDDTRLADQLLGSMQVETIYDVQRNAPYGPTDGVTHTIAAHAQADKLPSVMIEVRNNLIIDDASEQVMAEYLAKHLQAALSQFFPHGDKKRVAS